MRLTLRTLLAYLDDVLPPAQAKELGQKIAESDFASALVSRIREVVRRRRLTAPDVSGPGSGLDPNTVAEYLDSTLPPESVADVERICLDSDVHLAEVAACHQILTLVLGEPVEIKPESRERMYALAPPAFQDGGQTGEHAPAGTAGDGKPAATKKPAKDFAATIPDYLRRKPLWRRALPFVLVVGLIAAFFGLIVTDPSLNPFAGGEGEPAADATGEQLARRDGGEADTSKRAPREPQPSGRAPEQPEEPMTTEPDKKLAARNGKHVPGDLPPVPEGVIPPPPPDQPEPGDDGTKTAATVPGPGQPKVVEPAPSAVTGEPKKIAAASSGKPTPVEAEEVAPAGAAATEPADTDQPPPSEVSRPAPPIQYTSAGGILLRYVETAGEEPGGMDQRDWVVMPHRAMIHAGDRIASPEPFEAVLVVEGGPRLRLLGGTAVMVLGPSPAGPFGLKIERGRVVIEAAASSRADAGAAMQGPVLGVHVGEELFKVELMDPGTICGIEVVPAVPASFEKTPQEDKYTGALYTIRGSTRLIDGKGGVWVVHSDKKSAGRLWLTPSERRAASERVAQAVDLVEIPRWLDPDTEHLSTFDLRYARLYEREFEAVPEAIRRSDPAAARSVSGNVPPIVKDRRPRVSELAVRTLAVTESYPYLVEALARSEHEESRQAAIRGLREWLAKSVQHGELLKDELKTYFPAEDAAIVYRLLWGFDENDARDPQTSKQLIDWLEHPHIAVRELAFHHVSRLTGLSYQYRANRPFEQRKLSVNRWRMHLDNQGGALLKP